MKKSLLWMVVIVLSISMVAAFSFAGCKAEVPAEEEAAEEVTEEEEVAEKKGPFKIAFVPSIMGLPYFTLENSGFIEALEPLGDELIYIAPEKGTSEETIAILNNLLIQKVDGINFIPTDPTAQNIVCDDIRKAGIALVENGQTSMTGYVDMSAPIESNEEFVQAMIDSVAEMMDYEGEFGIISAMSTSALQSEWIEIVKNILKDAKYSKMTLLPVAYSDELMEKGYDEAAGFVKSYPDIKLLMPICVPAATAVGKFLTDKELIDKIAVTACGQPSQDVEYIKSGAIDVEFLWDIKELGYFQALLTRAVITGEITGAVGEKVTLGKLGEYTITEPNVLIYGKILKVTKENAEQWKNN